MKRKERELRLGRIIAFLIRGQQFDHDFLITNNKTQKAHEQINQHFRNHESINQLSR